ncbi:MAG: HEAT repeat domain-containing protein [Phycisphaerales bacterium]|nr:HEAT repeat domain-containing protein [Phycisphaerales bacterium]
MTIRESTRRVLDVAAAAALAGGALVGCAGDGGGTSGAAQPWSTRQQSIQPSGALNTGPTAPTPAPIPIPEMASLRDRALGLLEQAAEGRDPQLRANAIESLAVAPEVATSYAQRGLTDPNRGVRFVSAMTIANAKLCSISHLLEPLLRDDSASVRAAAILGLWSCGHRVDPTPLAGMMTSDDPEVRGNAALVLGELGNPSAIEVLRNSLGRGMTLVNPMRIRVVELQVAEALVRLGDSSEIDPIRAALFAPVEQSEIVVLACQIVGRLDDQNAAASLVRLIEAPGPEARPVEVRLSAIWALANMGLDVGPWIDQVATAMRSPNPMIRSQAAIVAGYARDPSLQPPLVGLLSDTDPRVQIAAARSLLRREG